jgi:exonuclease VII large subunit
VATAAKPLSRRKADPRTRPVPPARRAATRPPTRSKTMADPKKPAALDGDRNVDQIRDILFGGQMRDYERRFQELNQRLEADLARLRETQDKRLAQIDKRIDDQLEKLARLVRQEVEDRNGAVDDLESRLQQAARTARAEINKALEAHGGELALSDERLRGAIADLHAALNARAGEAESALSRTGAQLHAEKVGRDDLAALLTEFALRLRGDFDLPKPK